MKKKIIFLICFHSFYLAVFFVLIYRFYKLKINQLLDGPLIYLVYIYEYLINLQFYQYMSLIIFNNFIFDNFHSTPK